MEGISQIRKKLVTAIEKNNDIWNTFSIYQILHKFWKESTNIKIGEFK
jgi:hypothetical protein